MPDNKATVKPVKVSDVEVNGVVKRRMLNLLSDGRLHTMAELHSCLEDELGPVLNVSPHIFNLRKQLQSQGMTITTQKINRVTHYQLRRFIPSSSE